MFLMAREKIYVVPMIIEEKELGEEITPLKPRSVFLYRRGEHQPYPALSYNRGFVYVSGNRLYRTYVKTISGVLHLFFNDRSMGPIYGSLYNVVYNGEYHALAVQLSENIHAFIVLEGRRSIYQLTTITKGLFSKKICSLARISIGLAGKNIYAIAHTRGEPGVKCRDLLIYQKSEEKYEYREFEKLIPSGWNGLWFSYIDITRKNINIHFHLWDGTYRKYSLPRPLIPDQFLIPDSIIYYDHDRGVAVFNNSIELLSIDLKGKQVLWRRGFGGTIHTPYTNTGHEEVLAYVKDTIYIIDPTNGEPLTNIEVPSEITAASLSENYLLIGSNETLYLYSGRGRKYKLLTRYVIPGSINGITIQGDDVLIGYTSPGNIPKIIYVNLGDTISFKLKDIELTVNSVVEIPVKEIVPSIRVLKITSPQILITARGNKIIVADRGSRPGEYMATIEIDIPGFLSVLDDLKIKVEELKSAFRKLRIQSTIIPSPLGAYIPVVIDSIVPIDELYMVLTSRDGSIYGTTNIVRDIPRGETFIPLYIIWAKMGIHNVVLRIIGWSKRNRIHEEFRTRLKIEYDIPPFHLRVIGGTTYIWSPFSIDAAKITIRTRNAEYTIMHDLKRGWNEIETHGLIPEEVIISLREGITYVVRRGQSWIRLVKR